MKPKINLNFQSINIEKILRHLIIIIPIGVLINLIFSYATSHNTILPSFLNFSFGYLLLAVLLTLVPWLTNTLRLLIWTRFLGRKFSFKNILKVVLGTELGAAISPTAIGGAPVKIGMLIQQGLKSGNAVSITTLGSIEDHLFSIFAVPIALTISQSWKLPVFQNIFYKFYNPIVWVVGLCFMTVVLTGYLIVRRISKPQISSFPITKKSWLKKAKEKLKDFWKDFKTIYEMIYLRGKFRFLISMILTTIQWICRYSVISALLVSLGITVDPVRIFVLQWLVFTLMAFVPTPGATAGAETAFYLIYKSICPEEIIGLVTTGWRFLTFYFLLILGIVFFILLNLPQKQSRRRWIPSFKTEQKPAYSLRVKT